MGQIVSQSESEAKSKVFWLATLSLIQNMFEIFHEGKYDKVKSHVYMEGGNVLVENDWQKWSLIHQLCAKKVYKFDLKKKNQNANTFFEKSSLAKVKADLKNDQKNNTDGKDDDELTEEQLAEKEEREVANQLKHKEAIEKSNVLKYITLISEHHLRTETQYNVSESKLIIAPRYENYAPSNVPTEFVWTPDETVNQACDLLHARYGRLHNFETNRDDLRDMIYEDMRKFENFLLLDIDIVTADKVNNKPGVKRSNYSVKCAMILEEELVFQNKSTCAIIHCLASEFEYEHTHHLKSMLYEAFNQKNMRA